MELEEAKIRLNAISQMIETAFKRGQPMLLSTAHFLEQLRVTALGIEERDTDEVGQQEVEQIKHIIMSCDASIKQNPGGPSSVGVIIELPANIEPEPANRRLELSSGSPATSNNQAEYDAIYYGLTTLMSLRNNPGCKIEVRSDSQLCIKQLNGEMKCNDEKLKKRRDIIQELAANLPVEVDFQWRPRNSTPELELANYLAQDYLGVPRH